MLIAALWACLQIMRLHAADECLAEASSVFSRVPCLPLTLLADRHQQGWPRHGQAAP